MLLNQHSECLLGLRLVHEAIYDVHAMSLAIVIKSCHRLSNPSICPFPEARPRAIVISQRSARRLLPLRGQIDVRKICSEIEANLTLFRIFQRLSYSHILYSDTWQTRCPNDRRFNLTIVRDQSIRKIGIFLFTSAALIKLVQTVAYQSIFSQSNATESFNLLMDEDITEAMLPCTAEILQCNHEPQAKSMYLQELSFGAICDSGRSTMQLFPRYVWLMEQ